MGTKRVLETKKNSEDHSAEDIDNLTSYYTEKDAKSSKRKKLNIGLSVDSQCGDDIDDTLRASILDPEINLQMMTHEQFKQNFTALSDIKPSYIILYDPDISIVRSLETFQATVTSPLRVYFLLYSKYFYTIAITLTVCNFYEQSCCSG